MARTRTAGGRGVLRALAITVAIGLAAASTAAVVLSADPQLLRLAVVGALWAFVLAAFAAPRRRAGAGTGSADGDGLPVGKELELRRTYEIELEREVAARREYEMQLEVYLRRELERGLQEQVQTLREEVQQLRGDMIDRLDGELRMERIETTRLIGGSLRALQDEARRLGIGLQVPAELSEPSYSVRDRPELPAAALPAGWPTDPGGIPPAGAGYGSSGSTGYSSYPSYSDYPVPDYPAAEHSGASYPTADRPVPSPAADYPVGDHQVPDYSDTPPTTPLPTTPLPTTPLPTTGSRTTPRRRTRRTPPIRTRRRRPHRRRERRSTGSRPRRAAAATATRARTTRSCPGCSAADRCAGRVRRDI